MKGRADSGALNTRQLAATSGENDAGFSNFCCSEIIFAAATSHWDSGIGTFFVAANLANCKFAAASIL